MPTVEIALLGAIAAGLGWGGWVSTRGCRRVEAECPPLGSFVHVEGERLHYLEQGAGAPVVLVHGASTNLRDLAISIQEPLAQRFRAISVDRPGYGYSTRRRGRWLDPAGQARLLHGALRDLGAERPILVGHSWAAALVLAYALEFPDEVGGVVTLCGATHPWPGGVALYRYLGALPVLGPLLSATLIFPLGMRMADAAVRFTLEPDPAPADYRRKAGIDLLFRPGQFVADAQDVSRLCAFLREQSPRYTQLRVPLTIITGTRDRIVSPRLHSHALHAQVPHSKLIVLDGAGHAPHHHHRDAIVRAVAELGTQAQGSKSLAGAQSSNEDARSGPNQRAAARDSM